MTGAAGLALAFGGGLLASAPLIAALIRRPVLDAGDGQRKLQARPVPSSGGIAFGLPVLALAGIMAMTGRAGAGWLFLPAFGLVLGALDDRFGLGSALKMALMLAACAGAVALGFVAAPVDTPFGTWFGPEWARLAGSAFFLFVVMNAFNFMDGANALMGAVALVLAGTLLAAGVAPVLAWAVLAGGLTGFLMVNVAGRIYAGDAGSLFLGAVFGQAALSMAAQGGPAAWGAALALLPLLADVFLTLIWRARRGRPLMQAHRDHAYQRLIDRHDWRHAGVAGLYGGLTLACVIAAGLARQAGGPAPFWTFWGASALALALWLAVKRR